MLTLSRKNPVKCSACVVSQKIWNKCGMVFSEIRLFLENHSLEIKNLPQNYLRKKITAVVKKREF